VLATFLNSKPLYYDVIDYTRMPRVYESLKDKLKLPKIIHLIGTNGKGTTGRFLATALYSLGFQTAHYTSPHILNFNERIWLNGKNIENEILEKYHLKLLKLLSKSDADTLSYFEYTTLLVILICENMDYVVLEAGLGGEHDATAVFKNVLTLVTPIGIDHEAFLGTNITDIARTKLSGVQKTAILASQKYEEVYKVAEEVSFKKCISMKRHETYITKEDQNKIDLIAKENDLEEYLKENLTLSIAAVKHLGLEYSIKDFNKSRLFGRLSKIGENILVDVGHNTLAAKRIVESLKSFKYTLVYNSYKDKNYTEILCILRPIIDDIEIIEIKDERVEKKVMMEKALEQVNFKYKTFKSIDKGKNYLVFGSFSVVEAFLKVYSE